MNSNADPPGGSQRSQRYGPYLAVLGLAILVLVAIHTALTKPPGVAGVQPGSGLPPFAVPLAMGDVNGDANVATRADDGAAGKRPACSVRGVGILNVCQLYERSPVVLALFVDAGACEAVLSEMETLAPSFPGVRFAAVSIEGDRGRLRKLVRSRGLVHVPVGIDKDGALASLYKVASCPQVTFAYPGGIVQSKALLSTPSPPTLRARVQELVTDARARGWKEPRHA
ncbi:MAG TPA: hypothetical protein VGL68_02970 [Solirubrobacteraceae bacterium]|jgi:hypothetical protein